MSPGPDVVTVVVPVPITVRQAIVTAGAITSQAEVIEIREVATPAETITLIEPVNVAVVQSGPLALVSPSGDATYTFHQHTPSAAWHIPHPLNKRPSVSVQDSAGNLVIGEVQYLGNDLVVVTFLAPFSGRADLN